MTCGVVSVAEGDGGEVLTTAGAAGAVESSTYASGDEQAETLPAASAAVARIALALSAGTVVGIAKSPPAPACPLPAGVSAHAASE